MNRIECPIFEPDPGDRIRVLIRYEGSWRPIFWFKLAKDGSVYLAPRLSRVSELRAGKVAVPATDSQVRIQYSSGDSIDDPDVMKKAKLSFHGSGEINMAGIYRARGNVIRSLKEQILLCMMVFRHPGHFGVLDDTKVKDRDVCLSLPIDKERPLWGQMWVAPHANERIVVHNEEQWQINLFFRYVNIDEIHDLKLQLVLVYGAPGEWPPYNCVIFRERDAT